MEDRVKNLSGKNFHISRAARRHKDVSANERGMRGVNEPPPDSDAQGVPHAWPADRTFLPR
jgi:hypothetical protein